MRMSRKFMAAMGSAAVVIVAAGAYVAADAMSADATVRPAATCKASSPNQGTLTATGVISREPITSLSNPITAVPPEVGVGGSTKVTIGPVTITAPEDANTEKFLTALVTARGLPTVAVTLTCSGVAEYSYTFSKAQLIGVTTGWHGGGQSVAIQLQFGQVSETPRGGTTFCYDALTDRTC